MIRILVGDCKEHMAAMEPDSIDSIVTDPPYGLEFMGKEWDKLDAGLPQENVWKGRRGKGGSNVGDDDSKPSSRHHVSLGGKRSQFKRCTICGKRQFSGSPCQCDDPEWVVEYPDGAPSSMIRMQRWHESWAREAIRVLKPGGYLLAFGGTRTHHRLTVAIEDAGFEIRDCLMWLYGSGFPKSLDVSKALDKAAGAEREVLSSFPRTGRSAGIMGKETEIIRDITAPATDLSRQWDGWGTALKPAWEPIIMARKPLIGSVAANVTQYGTGGINVDGCRIGTDDDRSRTPGKMTPNTWDLSARELPSESHPAGRWPANVLLDDEAAAMLDAQSGELGKSSGGYRGKGNHGKDGWGMMDDPDKTPLGFGDTGGASRFFYTAKASRSERNKGLEGLEHRTTTYGWDGKAKVRTCTECSRRYAGNFDTCPRCGSSAWEWGENNGGGVKGPAKGNHHPTVKPLDLMQWLVRLVTPPDGTVLDPFMGSGSTLIAADREGFNGIGIELDAEYAEIARRRIMGDCPLFAEVAD